MLPGIGALTSAPVLAGAAAIPTPPVDGCDAPDGSFAGIGSMLTW
jgi:hypothetical protein